MALQLLVASVALLVVCGLCPTLISAAPGFLDAAGHRQLLQAPADGGSGDGPQLTVQAGQVPQVPVPGTDASGMERQSVFAAAPVPFNIWLYSLIPGSDWRSCCLPTYFAAEDPARPPCTHTPPLCFPAQSSAPAPPCFANGSGIIITWVWRGSAFCCSCTTTQQRLERRGRTKQQHIWRRSRQHSMT